MHQKYWLSLLLSVALTSSFNDVAHAASAGGSASASPYVELAPSFVTNYDGGGRLRYVKIDVSVRIQRPGDVLLQTHMPYIRNALVELFSSQLEEDLSSTEGKEKLRAETLAELRRVVDHLEGGGSENLLEVYFTSFVIQQ